jgi:long-chain acyl-CoA synthetase
VECCCLMGSGQPTPFAIVVLSAAARERCIDPLARKALEDSLRARMEAVNAELDPFERLYLIVIADGPWTIGNGLLTPTLKIKRGVLEGRYDQMIEEWRSQNLPVVWESVPSLRTSAYVAGRAVEAALRPNEAPPGR